MLLGDGGGAIKLLLLLSIVVATGVSKPPPVFQAPLRDQRHPAAVTPTPRNLLPCLGLERAVRSGDRHRSLELPVQSAAEPCFRGPCGRKHGRDQAVGDLGGQ